jgi:outer membrane protein TolC
LIFAGAFACPLAGLVHAADLLSVYRDAVTHDAQFGAARATLDAGREKLPQGRAGLLPGIGLGASTTWNETESTRRVNGATAAYRQLQQQRLDRHPDAAHIPLAELGCLQPGRNLGGDFREPSLAPPGWI